MLLEAEGISKDFAGLRALNDVSFQLEVGTIPGLIVPNGARKSTTLKTVLGLMHPPPGKIFLCDQPMTHPPPHEIVNVGLYLVPEWRGTFAFFHLSDDPNFTFGPVWTLAALLVTLIGGIGSIFCICPRSQQVVPQEKSLLKGESK